jgi:hypothetical protein
MVHVSSSTDCRDQLQLPSLWDSSPHLNLLPLECETSILMDLAPRVHCDGRPNEIWPLGFLESSCFCPTFLRSVGFSDTCPPISMVEMSSTIQNSESSHNYVLSSSRVLYLRTSRSPTMYLLSIKGQDVLRPLELQELPPFNTSRPSSSGVSSL